VLRDTIGAPLPPADRADYDRNIASARAQLDEATFAEAWAAGRSMPLDRAIAYAQERPLLPEQPQAALPPAAQERPYLLIPPA
jgi:hypothetical protein